MYSGESHSPIDRVVAIPASPPADVTDAVAGAAQAYERLAAAGCELRFHPNALTRRVVVQVHDHHCDEVRSIDSSELFGLLTEGE